MSDLNIQLDLESTPDSMRLAPNIYTVRVEKLEPQLNEDDGRLKVRGEFRVIDKDHANWPIYNDFWLGTDDDPLARQPETQRKPAFTTFKQLLGACQLPNRIGLEDACRALMGKQCMAKVGVYTSKATGNQGNQIREFYPLGARDVTRNEEPVQGAKRPAAQVNGAAGAPQVAPQVDAATPPYQPGVGGAGANDWD